jgi:hypothetical protein
MTEYALNTTLGIAFGFALGSVVGERPLARLALFLKGSAMLAVNPGHGPRQERSDDGDGIKHQ